MYKRIFQQLGIWNRPFIRDMAVFVSGSSVAYLLGVGLTPIIARLYSDEAYGSFALINTLVSNVLVFSTLNYSEALLLPKSNKEFLRLVQLCLYIAVFFSLLALLLVAIFGHSVLNLLKLPHLSGLLYYIPLIIFVNTSLIIWDSWNLRLKEYKRGAIAKTISTGISKSSAILLAIAIPGNNIGLIIGEYFSKLFNVFLLTSKNIYSKIPQLIRDFSIKEIKSVAFVFRNYPIYNLQSSVVVIIGNHMPIYLISTYYSIANTGQYSIAMSLLNAPIMLIGLSIAKVYMRRAVDIFHQEGASKLKGDVIKLYKNLIIFSFIPFLTLALFGDIIFLILLGSGWELAGQVVRILSASFMFQFVVLCIKSIFRVLSKEKLQFLIDAIAAVAMLISLIAVVSFSNHFIYLIVGYGLVLIATQVVSLYYIFGSLRVRNPLKYVLIPSILAGIVFSMVFLVRPL